jgi:F-type H+-transporting ATPase subunit c
VELLLAETTGDVAIFGSMIQAVARQPELRGELQGIQWLGFALTEAVVFYALLGGLLAFVLV